MHRTCTEFGIAGPNAKSICEQICTHPRSLRLGIGTAACLLFGASLSAAPLTWFPGTPLTSARSSAATVVGTDGRILIIGGSPPGSLNPLVYGGTNLQPLDTTRIAPGALVLGSGQVAVYGGKESSFSGSVMSSVIAYDP